MRHLYLLLVGAMLTFSASLYAQISHGGAPIAQSKALSLADVPVAALPTFDLATVMAEDTEDEKQGNYPKIGRVRPIDVNPAEFGTWTELDKGGRLWRAAVKSRDALGLSVQFEDFNLPNGAKLFLYSPDMKFVIGSFTEFNNHESGIFSTQIIPSDEVIVEYFEPASAAGSQPFRITGLVHCYRMVPGVDEAGAARDFGDSDPCQVNVNCSEGNNWQDEKRGVARIFIIEGQFAGWCTGSLVNNTAQDCTPYFLTALHCGETASASNMNQWVFYFNYESAGCSNGTSGQVPNNTVQGCSRIADSGDGGGNSGSDFLLVEFNNAVPAGYNAYYNGWNRANTASSSGVSIHHPAGDIKKISTYNSSLGSASWGGPSGTHWVVQWASTANGHGVTEGGSSGSPIFNNQGLIVGTLTGGSSFCNTPNNPDFYGKMSYHWNSNPGDDLDDFLDPTNSGVTSLAGSDNPCAGGGCSASIPYPESEPCVQQVIVDDPFCCDNTWDATCETAYQTCVNAGGNCEAGTVSVALSQDICPGETGIYDATGFTIPDGGGYAVQFIPDGGTGGNGTGFSISGLEEMLPWEFDDDLNGILSFNALPPLEGTWIATGFVYEDPNDVGNTACSIAADDITLNFLAANDPACTGGGCAAAIPYPESDPCVQQVIAADTFCCDDTWDSICEDAYVLCAGGACAAGDISVSLDQDICPGETGIFDATNIVIPDGGDYAVSFTPNGGTGGNGTGFSITGLGDMIPWEFDSDLNGILSFNDLPPLEGTWVIEGLAYADELDFANSVCSITDLQITLNFLAADDPACSGGGCAADIPYPESDPCVQQVIVEDSFCCDDTWDNICEEAYVACNGGGDCVAGDVSVSLNQNICPGETGIFDATGITIPDGGGYAVQFLPNGGTGGNDVGFSITGLEGMLPWEFDDDLNGILSFNDLPPLEGTWVITGLVYEDPLDFANTVCDQTVLEITLNFLAASDPLCQGGGDDNDACADAITITPGSYPFSTETATTDGPDQPGSDCDAFNESNVANDIWYLYTATCNGTASLSTCGTADYDTRLAVYPAGQCPPTAGSLILCNDDFDGCLDFTSFLEWDITAGTTYLLRVGGYSAIDAGTGTIELVENCEILCVADIPYPESDPCVQTVIADDPFCCDTSWDNTCETAYQDCLNAGGDACLDWVDPSPTTGWNNFNTEFGGAPANDGTGCPFNEIQDFEVWMSEAYAMDNVVAGTSYTFSHCNGPGAGTWVPEYTIIAPSGAVDAYGPGDGDGCSITWTASESGTYLIVINEAGNCGNGAQTDNGWPAITCNDPISGLDEVGEASFGIFPNPNTGQFSILYNGSPGVADIQVVEVSGKVVQATQFTFNDGSMLPIDLGDQATGMYFVRITMNDAVSVQKVVVR